MAQQLLNLKISGLWTNPNDFSEVPPGSLAKAVNVVVDRESIVESRRGLKIYSNSLGNTDVSTLFMFNDVVLALTEDNKLWRDNNNTGIFSEYSGSYARPTTQTNSRSAKSNKNLYFTTDNGLMKLTSVDATPRLAGSPKALAGTATVTGTSGWLDNLKNVAYRIVWGYKDANANLILSAPSDRIIVSNNAGASRNVSLTIQVPVGVDTTWFYQIYRSDMSADLATQPSDALQQVYEKNATAGEITAKSITVVDIVPDTLKQAALYTNSTQEGIASANWAPPFAKDLCTFKNYTFFANTRTVHRKAFNLISVAGTEGLQLADTITISNGVSSIIMTAGAANNVGTRTFKLTTSLTPAENVEQTSRDIVLVMNQVATNTFINAYYNSGYDQLPGQILLEKRDLSTGAFTIASTRASCWSPRLDTPITSDNDVMPNRIYYSKLQQPEAVPLLNYLDVGSTNAPIERILTLRDGIIILKTDGIFRLTGDTDSSFRVSLIDSTVKILAPETAVVLSNRVYFYSDQGVIAASDSGAQVISRPIENLINFFSSTAAYPNLYEEAFGISYESDHKYILFLPETGTNTSAKQAYVFNIFTNNWTQWIMDANCGIQSTYDNKLYLGCPYRDADEQAHVKIERKDFTSADYADIEFEVNLLNQVDNILYFDDTPSLVSKIQVDDVIYQDGNRSVVLSISADYTHAIIEQTVINDEPWTYVAGVSTIFRPIAVSFRFNSLDAENPGIMKHFQRIAYLIDSDSVAKVYVRFASDLSDLSGSTVISLKSKGSWGSGEWGNVVWGEGESAVQRVDSIVPQTNQRANWLSITMDSASVFNAVSFSGVSLIYTVIGERFK